MFSLFTCIISIVLALVIWLTFKLFEELASPLRRIPTPPGGFPLVGHLFTFAREKDLLSLLSKWSERYGPVFRYSPGFGFGVGAYRVYVTDPVLIKQVLVTNFHKYKKHDFVREVVPNLTSGLFTSSGSEHARQRRMVTAAFSSGKLEELMPVMREEIAKLIQLWRKKCGHLGSSDPVVIDVFEDIKRLSLDIIGRAAFGYHFDTVLRGDTEVSSAFKELMQGMSYGAIIRRRLIPFYKYLPFPDSIGMRNAIKMTNKTVLKVIKERRVSRSTGQFSDKKDLLDVLLDMYDEETKSCMDDEELRCQVLTFALAGHETVTATLSWALYELCKHDTIQDKAAQESIKVLSANHTPPNWQQLNNLKYLGQVIKETLRLHPPAFLTHRSTIREDTLGGYVIPKGTFVAIGIDSVQRSSKYWEDPLMFDPDRFQEHVGGPSPVLPYTYLPFSAGPRTCIGYKFAIAELKLILGELLRHFRFTAPQGLQVKPLIRLVTRPDPPLKLLVEERDKD